MTARLDPSTLAHAAGLIHAVLATLRDLPARDGLDPAHDERLEAVEEAARLVADAAVECPRSLRAAPLAAFRGLVLRLALETDDPSCAGDAYAGDAALAGLETLHGTCAASLMGLAMALSAVEGAVGRVPVPEAVAPDGLVWVPRLAVRAWTRQVVAAVSRLESDVLRGGADPAVARDAWSLACLVSLALAHVTDHACVDVRAALTRVAEAGAALSQAVALRASQDAAGGGGTDAAAQACLDLVGVVEEGVRLLRTGVDARGSSAATLAWRLVSRGRTGLGPERIEAIVRACGASVRLPAAELARAARSYEDEWRAA